MVDVDVANLVSLYQELRECLDGGLKISPTSRDLHYGMLRLRQLEKVKGSCTAEDLLDTCKQYFSMRCNRLSCFDDLRDPLGVLDAKFQRQFIEFAVEGAESHSESKIPTLIPTLSSLKFEYCFFISHQLAVNTTPSFVRKVVDTYQQFCIKAIDSGEPYAQLAMLACMATLRVGQTEQEGILDQNLLHVCQLQTAFLLRYCLTRCRDDYPTLVVLTRICTLLGAISLSATFFKKLSIKNLQWENASHLLLTRISTLHPPPSKGSEGAFDPLQLLDLALAANANSVKSVRRLIMVGLKNKSYVNVMETVSLREDLKRSFSKQIYVIESGRCQRLRSLSSHEGDSVSSGKQKSQISPSEASHANGRTGHFTDRRDFSFIPSFESPSSELFSQYLEAGPRPKVCTSPDAELFMSPNSSLEWMALRNERLLCRREPCKQNIP